MVPVMMVMVRVGDEKFPIILIILALFMLVMMLFVAFVFPRIFRPWLQAYLSGCPLAVIQILAMKMRRSDVSQIVRCGVMARQADCPISWGELEQAYLQRVDLEKVTLAYIESQQDGNEWKFADLVDGDRRNRLADMLGES